jgi:hypothetical protein
LDLVFGISAALVVVIAVVVWLVFWPSPQRIKASELQAKIEYLLSACEPESALMFSKSKRRWPIRLRIESIDQEEAHLSVSVYTPELQGTDLSEINTAITKLDQMAPQMPRPAMESILAAIFPTLGINDEKSTERLFVRGAPIIYGRRMAAMTRDSYEAISDAPKFMQRIGKANERKARGTKTFYPALIRFSAAVLDTVAPDPPAARNPDVPPT